MKFSIGGVLSTMKNEVDRGTCSCSLMPTSAVELHDSLINPLLTKYGARCAVVVPLSLSKYYFSFDDVINMRV